MMDSQAVMNGGEIHDPPARRCRRRNKYYVDDVEVSVVTERVQYLDADGRLITESLKTIRGRQCENTMLH